MRITNQMASDRYIRDLSNSYSRLNMSYQQAMSGRRYDKMSQDTSSAVRAMQVRRNLSKLDAYTDNVQSAQSVYSAAETQLMQINDIAHDITELWTQAMTDTTNDDGRAIDSRQLKSMRDELLTVMNARFSDRYLFGGTNSNTQPFTVDDNGNLYYNGVDVKTIDSTNALLDDVSWADIGLRPQFTDDNDPQAVDSSTAFKMSFVGVEFLGYGSENLYNILSEMIDLLDSGNFDNAEMGDLLTRFQKAESNVNIQLTQLGADTKYLEFTLGSLKDQRTNLLERQQQLEGIDSAEAIMNLKVQEYIYNAALQLGQRLLQPTLFNFIS